MPWRNSETGYGWVSIALHWGIAVAIIGLFALGLWMTGLTYYDPWYNRAPSIHKSLGILVLVAVLVRLAWRLGTRTPAFEPGLATWERSAALTAHWVMYALMLAVLVSGYLIPTADGDPVSVFGWFEVPALPTGLDRQEDVAGWAHYWTAWALMGVAALHTLAALKHHFIDGDRTLRRMIGVRR